MLHTENSMGGMLEPPVLLQFFSLFPFSLEVTNGLERVETWMGETLESDGHVRQVVACCKCIGTSGCLKVKSLSLKSGGFIRSALCAH